MKIENLKINKGINKPILLITSLALSFTLSACGNKKVEVAEEPTAVQVSTTDIPTPTPRVQEMDTIVEDNEEKEKRNNSYKEELLKKYHYVSSVIVRNGKEYVKVRKAGNPDYGWVSLDTLEEVIPVGKYDYISNEIIINDRSYVKISIKEDDGYAYGLLSLDTFAEVVPCKTYDKINFKEDNDEEILECLLPDSESFDIYVPSESKILIKK